MIDVDTILLCLGSLLVPVGAVSLMRGSPTPTRGRLGSILGGDPLLRRTGDMFIILVGLSACARLAYRFGWIRDAWAEWAGIGYAIMALVMFLYLALWIRALVRHRAGGREPR